MADKWYNTRLVAEKYAKEIIARIPSDTERSHISGYDFEINDAVMSVKINFHMDVVSNSIEQGRKPGKMPPVEAISIWTEKKGIVPEPIYERKAPTKKQLDFLIARHIGEEGTEGKHYLDTIRKELTPIYAPLFEEAITKDVEAQLEEEYAELMKK